ncbi:MAG: hypothetical protein ACOCV1_01620 [Bacillota bacterium]
MALKDWKKLKTPFPSEETKYQKGNIRLVINHQVFTSYYADAYYRDKNIPKKIIRIPNFSMFVYEEDTRKILEDKKFKTKQEALKYAKSYMRKH